MPTVRKWLGRYLLQGELGLRDASSRPRLSPRAIAPRTALVIVELRRRFLTHARIAQSLGVSESTVSRVLARAGLSRWGDLEPSEPVVRYEHAHPGDLLHIDTKKLGRIVRMGHRVTGNPRDSVEGAGWEFLFVAVDDHARIGFTQMKPDECQDSAIAFLRATVAYFASLGVSSAACSPTTARPFAPSALLPPAAVSDCNIVSPVPIGRRPMAKLNVSSNPPCANGPMASLTIVPPSALPCSTGGTTITTGIARIKASAASHPCRASAVPETTS